MSIARGFAVVFVLGAGGCTHPASQETPMMTGRSIPLLNVATVLQDEWEPLHFSGETIYEIVSVDERAGVRAIRNDSASGLIQFVQTDIGR
jgi:hypothetical protein